MRPLERIGTDCGLPAASDFNRPRLRLAHGVLQGYRECAVGLREDPRRSIMHGRIGRRSAQLACALAVTQAAACKHYSEQPPSPYTLQFPVSFFLRDARPDRGEPVNTIVLEI